MTPLPHSREMPASQEAEEHVLACCLLEGSALENVRRCREDGVSDQDFYWPANRYTFLAIAALASRDIEPSLQTVAEQLGQMKQFEQVGGFPYLMQVASKIPTSAHRAFFTRRVLELSAKRSIIKQASLLVEHAFNGTSLEELAEQAKTIVPEVGSTTDWASRRLKLTTPPCEPSTRLFLAGKPVATPGNLVTIISRAKTGKTATLGGVVAAIIGAHYDRQDLDTLGFTAPHTNEAVVVIDTEQSPFDAWTCHQRTMARAKQPDDPPWLCHYALVGYAAKKLRESLPQILKKCRSDHKGIFTLILDGVADFVTSVNDEVECNEFISWLRALSIEYNCPIICVIHSNEGIKNGDDGRGWLGKELTRKAESNLLLKKVGPTTSITSEKQRKAPITEADGIAFQWSDELQRHTLCAPVVKPRGGKPKLHSIEEFMECIPFKDKPGLSGSQLHKKAITLKEIKIQTFKDLLNEAAKDGILIRTYNEATGYTYTKSV